MACLILWTILPIIGHLDNFICQIYTEILFWVKLTFLKMFIHIGNIILCFYFSVLQTYIFNIKFCQESLHN